MPKDLWLNQSASIVLKTLLKIGATLIFSGLLGLVVCLSLLPKLAVCSTNGLGCTLVVLALVYSVLLVPFMTLWGLRGFVLMKVLFEVYSLHEARLLHFMAEQICQYRPSIVAAGALKASDVKRKMPLPIRLLMNRLDLGSLVTWLKQHPAITPAELVPELKRKIESQGVIKKPTLAWFYLLMLSQLAIFFVVIWCF